MFVIVFKPILSPTYQLLSPLLFEDAGGLASHGLFESKLVAETIAQAWNEHNESKAIVLTLQQAIAGYNSPRVVAALNSERVPPRLLATFGLASGTYAEMFQPCNDLDCGVSIPHVKGKHSPVEDWNVAMAFVELKPCPWGQDHYVNFDAYDDRHGKPPRGPVYRVVCFNCDNARPLRHVPLVEAVKAWNERASDFDA